MMDIFLLCAGFGTRLRPLTDHLPKCLAPIGNVPLLAVWLSTLSELSFTSRVFINSHYLFDQVQDFIDNNSFGLDIELIIEPSILGTAGSIKNQLVKSIEKDFMIVHGDNLSVQDFGQMFKVFTEETAIDRMAGLGLGFKSEDYINCGFYSHARGSNKITGYIEKPGYRVDGLANGAIFMLTKELLLESMEHSSGDDFCKDNLPSIASSLSLFEADGIHIDIGNPSSLAKAQSFGYLSDKIKLDEDWHGRYLEKVSRLSMPVTQ